MLAHKRKEKEEVLWILNKELKYFLREYSIVEKLDIYAKSQNLKSMQSYLKKLERFERREQFRASVNRLNKAVARLLRSPWLIAPDARNKIRELVRKMKVFEADLLNNTVRELEPILKNKSKIEINWVEVRQIIAKLIQDLQALTVLDRDLKKAVEG